MAVMGDLIFHNTLISVSSQAPLGRHRTFRAVICILAILSLLPGLHPTALAQTGDAYPISGTVIDGSDDLPVVRAQVRLLRASDRVVLQDSIFTDQNGAFQSSVVVGTGSDLELPVAERYSVSPASPNPVSRATRGVTIRYTVPGDRPELPEVELYDALGRRLFPGEPMASGVYFYTLRFPDGQRTEARKLVLVEPAVLRIDLVQQVAKRPATGETSATLGKAGLESLEAILVVERAGYVTHEQAVTLLEGVNNRFDVTLDVAPHPTAAFSVSGDLGAGALSAFDASASEGADGTEILAYTWEFGNGRRGGGERITHIYTEAGMYTVTLTVTGRYGAIDRTTRHVVIGEPEPPTSENAVISGLVQDVEGRAVPEATVRLLHDGPELSAQTDMRGRVELRGLPRGIPVTLEISKRGYALQRVTQTIPPIDGESFVDGYFEIRLLPREPAITLPAVEFGGAVRGSDGTYLELPVDGLMKPDGTPASGPVQISLTPVDVADSSRLAAFPGDFSGITADGLAPLILSYGAAEYVITQNGEQLQFVPGKTAVIEIPIFVRLHEDGSEIEEGDAAPLWSLDEETGLWVMEGEGTVVQSDESPTGLALRAEVTHLSWWNCDVVAGGTRPFVVPRPYAVPTISNPQFCDPLNQEAWCKSPSWLRHHTAMCQIFLGTGNERYFERDCDKGEEAAVAWCLRQIADDPDGVIGACGGGKTDAVVFGGARISSHASSMFEDGDFNGNGIPWDDEDWDIFCDGNPMCGDEFGAFCSENPWFCPGVTLHAEPYLPGTDARFVSPVLRVRTNIPSGGRSVFVPPDRLLTYTATAHNGLFQGHRTTAIPAGERPTLIIPIFAVPPGTGGQLACGASERSVLEALDDADVWTISGTAGDFVLLNVSPSTGSTLEGTVMLRTPSGVEMPLGTFGSLRRIVELPETGSYELLIQGTANTPGTYDLGFVCLEESNKIGLHAEAGDTLRGARDNFHFFEAQADDLVRLAILTDRQVGMGRVWLELHDFGGNILTAVSLFGGVGPAFLATDVMRLPQAGTYAIRLFSDNAASDVVQPYLLGLSKIEEPVPITVNGPTVTLSGEIQILGERHFYRFSGTQGTWHNLVLSHPEDSHLNAVGSLRASGVPDFFRPSVGLSATSTDHVRRTSHSTPALPVPADGPIMIEIYGTGTTREAHTGRYEVTLNTPEPTFVSLDTETEAIFTSRAFNVFEFDGTAGEHINVAVLPTGFSGPLRPRLVDPSGGQITTNALAGYRELRVRTLTQSGRYQVIVDVPSHVAVGGEFVLGLPRIEEPEAISLQSPSVTMSGDIGILGGRWFYRFDGSENDARNFVISHPPGSMLNATLTVRRPGAQVFFNRPAFRSATTNATTRTAETGDVSLPATGEYVLEVQGASGNIRAQHTGAFEVIVEE